MPKDIQLARRIRGDNFNTPSARHYLVNRIQKEMPNTKKETSLIMNDNNIKKIINRLDGFSQDQMEKMQDTKKSKASAPKNLALNLNVEKKKEKGLYEQPLEYNQDDNFDFLDIQIQHANPEEEEKELNEDDD